MPKDVDDKLRRLIGGGATPSKTELEDCWRDTKGEAGRRKALGSRDRGATGLFVRTGGRNVAPDNPRSDVAWGLMVCWLGSH